ncbi:MAG TPA: DUF898 family protein [Candidatus Acidoferrum sp.]|nr:DUF898 family protein [Candidatus Acidoferrum sp.]
MTEPCPRCGAESSGEKCPQCGVVIALYRASLEKLRRGPAAAPVAAPSPASAFRPPAPPTAPTARPSGSAGPRLDFHGSAGGLFGIQAVNILFTLLTLGVYYFWARPGCVPICSAGPSSTVIGSRTTAPARSC